MRNGMPNFSAVAQGYHLDSFEVKTVDAFETFIKKIQKDSKPYLIDVNVIEKENCYPMVTPGRSNSQMLGLENLEKKNK